MRYALSILSILLLLPAFSLAQNAGIVDGLWYDQETFFAGTPVRVYVAIRNNTGADLSGTVEFFVNDFRIDRRNVDALDGRIIESWADWTPGYGTSTVRASLSRTEISSTASGTAAIEITSDLAESTIFIDLDTDGDLIGNHTDPDDDNDGIADADDINPLDFDQPDTIEPSETTTTETASETDAPVENTAVNRGSNEPEGLEQYLTESRADSAFTGLTNTINETKKRVDAYRIERSSDTTVSEPDTAAPPSASSNTATSSPGTTSDDGFGAITRTTTTDQPKSDGWLSTIWNLIIAVISSGYTFILFLLSFILSYPSLLQVALLILIIYLIIKTAKRLAGRPG